METQQQGVTRRLILESGLAAVAAGFLGTGNEVHAQHARPTTGRGDTHPGIRSIDVHAHYYSQAYFDLFNSDGKRFNADFRSTDQGFYYKTPNGSNGPYAAKWIDLKQRISDMDQQGLAMQVLSLTAPMVYWGDADLSHKLSTAWNDGASNAHLAYPDRILGFCVLPMLYSNHAIDELNRASKLPGIRGVGLGTNIDHRDLDDPIFEPVWSRIEQLDFPVFLHAVQTIGGERLRPFYLGNFLGNPFDTAIAASHLIFGGVLDRYPKLRFILPYAGGAFPILIGRIDHGWRVRPETKHLPKAPSSYLDRFYFDTIAHSKPIMEFLISEVGVERIVLGSDYAADMGYENPIAFLEQISLSRAQREMILGGTASKLLKL